MKRFLALMVVVFGIGIGCKLILARNAALPKPAVVISITQSNSPLEVFPGIAGAYFVLPDHSLWAWGESFGPVPTRLGSNCDWARALKMNNHSLGLRTNGTIWEWGYRGDGHQSVNAVQVDPRTNWIAIAGGDVHSAALNADGTIWTWGDNMDCQLGNGPGPGTTNLVQVGTDSDWRDIGAGQGSYTMGLKRDGTLWVWGRVQYFRNGSLATTFSVPTQVCSATNWTEFTCVSPNVVNDKSELWYPFGSLPGASFAASNACFMWFTNWQPGTISYAVVDPRADYSYMLRLKSDGTLWRCKYSPNRGAYTSPEQVGKRSDWVKLWGEGTVYGQTADGTLWAFGQDFGQASIPDFDSRFKRLLWDARGIIGLPRGNLSGQGSYPCRNEPWPLMRVVPENPTNAPGPL